MNASAVGKVSVRRPFAPRSEASDAAERPTVEGTAARRANALRGLMGHAQDTCRLRVVAPTVQLVEYTSAERGARLAVHGVHTCKSALCPLCAPKWQRTRSDEISQAIDHWEDRGGQVFFVTNTMRHHKGMRLALVHRILTHAWGDMWSGSGGARAAAAVGGKPESIRGHDRTWNEHNGWHPHLHCLVFVADAELKASELEAVIDARWRGAGNWEGLLLSTLGKLERMALRMVERTVCGREDCRACYVPFQGPLLPAECGPWRQIGESLFELEKPPDPSLGVFELPLSEREECPHIRERATRLFGVRLVPRERRRSDGVKVAVSLVDSGRRLLDDLAVFRRGKGIVPTRERGVWCSRMRDDQRLPNYLAKMGLEVAASLGKLGHVGSDGILRYGLWEVAELCGRHGDPLRPAARRAWSELFWATFGTQTITFSDREALGLPDDPYADESEPDEQRADELEQCIGEVQPPVWHALGREKHHELVAEVHAAYARGELLALPYVEPPDPSRSRPLRGGPRPPPECGPPATADPSAVDGDGFLLEPVLLGERGEVCTEAAEQRGREAMRRAWERANELESQTPFLETVRQNLAAIIGGKRDG